MTNNEKPGVRLPPGLNKAFRRIVDNWFLEPIHVEQNEQDERDEHTENPSLKIVYRQIENRRDPEKLKALIREELNRKVNTLKDYDKWMFREYRVKEIDKFQDLLCNNFEVPENSDERTLHKDLEAYKAALFEIVPDEVTAQTRHPETHPFITTNAYEVFKFLADEYRKDKFVKWSEIYEFLKDNSIETHLSARSYLQWIQSHYEPEMKSINLQSVTSDAHSIMTGIYQRYKAPSE